MRPFFFFLLIICSVKLITLHTKQHKEDRFLPQVDVIYIQGYQMNSLICVEHVNLLPPDTQSQFRSRSFSPSQLLPPWVFRQSALGHTPEPCYATAPKHLPSAAAAAAVSVHHLPGRSLHLHMDYLLRLPPRWLSPVTARPAAAAAAAADHTVCTITQIERSLNTAWCTHVFSLTCSGFVCVTSSTVCFFFLFPLAAPSTWGIFGHG